MSNYTKENTLNKEYKRWFGFERQHRKKIYFTTPIFRAHIQRL